jgi:hypothetical protein
MTLIVSFEGIEQAASKKGPCRLVAASASSRISRASSSHLA